MASCYTLPVNIVHWFNENILQHTNGCCTAMKYINMEKSNITSRFVENFSFNLLCKNPFSIWHKNLEENTIPFRPTTVCVRFSIWSCTINSLWFPLCQWKVVYIKKIVCRNVFYLFVRRCDPFVQKWSFNVCRNMRSYYNQSLVNVWTKSLLRHLCTVHSSCHTLHHIDVLWKVLLKMVS